MARQNSDRLLSHLSYEIYRSLLGEPWCLTCPSSSRSCPAIEPARVRRLNTARNKCQHYECRLSNEVPVCERTSGHDAAPFFVPRFLASASRVAPIPAATHAQTVIASAREDVPVLRRHCSMLIAPAPKAAIWSRPPAIMTSFRKWNIWFWSAKLLWNETAAATEKMANASGAGRIWQPRQKSSPPPSSTATATAKTSGGIGSPTAAIIAVVGP